MQKPSVNLKLDAQINLIPQSSRENRTMDRFAELENKVLFKRMKHGKRTHFPYTTKMIKCKFINIVIIRTSLLLELDSIHILFN